MEYQKALKALILATGLDTVIDYRMQKDFVDFTVDNEGDIQHYRVHKNNAVGSVVLIER